MNMTEIERETIAQIIVDRTKASEAFSQGLRPHHFTIPLFQNLFAIAIDGVKSGKKLGVYDFSVAVGRQHESDIALLRHHASLSLNYAPFVQAMLDNHQSVEIQQTLIDFAKTLTNRPPMAPIEKVLSEGAMKLMAHLGGVRPELETDTGAEWLGKSLKNAEDRMTRQAAGITTGLPTLDRNIFGWQPGFLYCLAARLGVGKTTMAICMADAAASAGAKTAFVTVEMSGHDVTDKLLMRRGRVDGTAYNSGVMSDDELDRIVHAARGTYDLPLLITEVTKPTFEALSMELTRLVRMLGVQFVIIDYLTLFSLSDGQRRTSREEVAEMSRRLKCLARDLQVPILVLAQLNREAPEHGMPDVRHIAESDQLGRDADVVLFLYQGEPRGGHEPDFHLGIGKNRRGLKGEIDLKANLQWSDFSEK